MSTSLFEIMSMDYSGSGRYRAKRSRKVISTFKDENEELLARQLEAICCTLDDFLTHWWNLEEVNKFLIRKSRGKKSTPENLAVIFCLSYDQKQVFWFQDGPTSRQPSRNRCAGLLRQALRTTARRTLSSSQGSI